MLPPLLTGACILATSACLRSTDRDDEESAKDEKWASCSVEPLQAYCSPVPPADGAAAPSPRQYASSQIACMMFEQCYPESYLGYDGCLVTLYLCLDDLNSEDSSRYAANVYTCAFGGLQPNPQNFPSCDSWIHCVRERVHYCIPLSPEYIPQ